MSLLEEAQRIVPQLAAADIWVGWKRDLLSKEDIYSWALEQATIYASDNREIPSEIIDLTLIEKMSVDDITETLQKLTGDFTGEFRSIYFDQERIEKWEAANDLWRLVVMKQARLKTDDDKEFLQKLGEIWDDFGFPEDMRDCIDFVQVFSGRPSGAAGLVARFYDFEKRLYNKIANR